MSGIADADARSAVLVATEPASAGRTLHDWMLSVGPGTYVQFTESLVYWDSSISRLLNEECREGRAPRRT